MSINIGKYFAPYRGKGKIGVIPEEFLDQALEDAKYIMKQAIDSYDVKNRTYFLRSAFGCAVYNNKKLVRKAYSPDESHGVTHKGWTGVSVPGVPDIAPNTARGYVDEFLASYVPEQDGVVIVVFNSAYYADILERGAQSDLGRKYHIISQVNFAFDRMAEKYGVPKSNYRRIDAWQ